MMEPRPDSIHRIVTAEDLAIAQRVADYYSELKIRNVYEPALSTCTVAFQQAITRTSRTPVDLVIGKEEKVA